MLDDGWFYCTVLDLEESTTYGKKTQDRAIKRLIDEGLIEYKRAGLPAKRYFRLTNDFNSLCRVIQEGEKKGLEIREKRRKSENAEKPIICEIPTIPQKMDSPQMAIIPVRPIWTIWIVQSGLT